MSIKRKGRPPSWETQAMRDLMSDGTTRRIFQAARDAASMLEKISDYIGDPSIRSDRKSICLLHAGIICYYCRPFYDGKRVVAFGSIGGLSKEFIEYALEALPRGTLILSVLKRALDQWNAGVGQGQGGIETRSDQLA